MKRLSVRHFLLSALILGASVASAQTTTEILVLPETPVFDANNIVGIEDDAAPGFETGSFASNGVAKTDIYLTPEMLFQRPFTLGEIVRMSYFTKKGETHQVSPGDWYLTIYTLPYQGDCSSGGWYGDRIGTEPYFSININDPANTWNQWTTGGAQNQLRFFESTSGCQGANFGSYTDPDWATFVAANSLSGSPYAGHGVLFVSIQTGSAWAAGFTGQLDGFEIELADGSVATVNFEKVEPPPAPASVPTTGNVSLAILIVLLLSGGLVAFRRYS